VGGQILEETSYDAFLHTEVPSYPDIKTSPLLNTFYNMHKLQMKYNLFHHSS